MSVGHATLSGLRVRALEALSLEEVRQWGELYEQTGLRVQQSHAYARATGRQVVVAHNKNVVAAFTVGSRVCTALGGDEPSLGPVTPSVLVALLRFVRQETDRSVYAPLISVRHAEFALDANFGCWQRPPNSLIDWSDQGRSLLHRVRARGNSQIDRKRRILERDGLMLDMSTVGEDAARDVLAVDDRSWKAAVGQSMRQRGRQAKLYGSLVRDRVLSATFLRHGTKPVAFRLDGRTGARLTCLKWSYDEAYSRYSPGRYLLTDGLVRQWADRGVRVVDLFGAPDTLKDLLHTHRVPRVDVWYGDCELGAEVAHNRHELDAKVEQVRTAGRGLRHASYEESRGQ